MLVWMAEEPMVPGKPYLFKHTTKMVTGTVGTLRYRVDVNTLHRQEIATLRLNEIGRCGSRSASRSPTTAIGGIAPPGHHRDRPDHQRTVGAGMILDRVTREERADHWDDRPVGT